MKMLLMIVLAIVLLPVLFPVLFPLAVVGGWMFTTDKAKAKSEMAQ